MRRLVLSAALLALLVPAAAAAADPGGLEARGVGDLLEPTEGDEAGASGTSKTPIQPTLVNLLIVGPALGLLVLGAWVAGPRRSRDDEPGSRGPSDEAAPSAGAAGSPSRPEAPLGSAPGDVEDAEARDPDGEEEEAPSAPPASGPPGDASGDVQDDLQEPPDGWGGASGEEDPSAADLPTGGDLPGPDDLSETEPGVPRILRLGKEAVDEGDLEDAVEWFDTAIAADPDLGVAHLCRGLSLEEMGRHEDAADAFRSAAEADPGDVAARYLLARALAEAGEPREALVHLRQVLDLVPELADLARDDEGFQVLRDDPRFLAALGDL